MTARRQEDAGPEQWAGRVLATVEAWPRHWLQRVSCMFVRMFSTCGDQWVCAVGFSGPQSFACILKERERDSDLSVIPAGVVPSVRRSRRPIATTPPSQRPVKTKRLSKHRVPGSTHHTRIEEGKEGHATGIEINVKMPIPTDDVKGNEATCEHGKMNSKMHQGKELYWVSVKDGTEGEQGTESTHHQEDKAVEIDPANGIFDSGVGVQPSFLELFAGTARVTGAIMHW